MAPREHDMGTLVVATRQVTKATLNNMGHQFSTTLKREGEGGGLTNTILRS